MTLSYKEFMEDVRMRLRNYSLEDMRILILNWAGEEHPSKRQEFLSKLTAPKQTDEVVSHVETLLDEIAAYGHRVEDGDYCDGWGWDDAIHEERDWGDESWAEEMDEFLLEARSLLLQGEYKLAEEAYRQLFAILELGQEPGHLPGDLDSSNMLNVDLDEQVALFLRSVYQNSPFEERPASLYASMNEYGNLVGKIKLTNITNALDSLLPDFDAFLTEWIDFLKNQTQKRTSELLREAVFLKGGIPAIAEFARQNADKYPRAYIDWIGALELKDDTNSVIEVAKEALSRIPRDYTVRAEVAETIAKTGEKLNDNKLKFEGYRECFHSAPRIKYLLDLYIAATECGCFEEIRGEAEQRIMELRDKSRVTHSDYPSRELSTSFVSEGLVCNALLLGGRYEKVFEMCEGKGPLGWSSSDNPKPVFVFFMLKVLSKEERHTKILYKQWDESIGITSYYASKEFIEKYRKIVDFVTKSLHLTREQEDFYLKWCINTIGGRIDAIVGNQHRGSYHKAAGLLVAMAETLANREDKQEGMQLIERYRSKYPRHSAFKSEVIKAVQASDIY